MGRGTDEDTCRNGVDDGLCGDETCDRCVSIALAPDHETSSEIGEVSMVGIELVHEQVVRTYQITDDNDDTSETGATGVTLDTATVTLDRAADSDEWAAQVKVGGDLELDVPGTIRASWTFRGHETETPSFVTDAVADAVAHRTPRENKGIWTRRLALSFSTSNAAFDIGDGDVAADVLNEIAEQLRAGHRDGVIHDANGNRIGRYELH